MGTKEMGDQWYVWWVGSWSRPSRKRKGGNPVIVLPLNHKTYDAVKGARIRTLILPKSQDTYYISDFYRKISDL